MKLEFKKFIETSGQIGGAGEFTNQDPYAASGIRSKYMVRDHPMEYEQDYKKFTPEKVYGMKRKMKKKMSKK